MIGKWPAIVIDCAICGAVWWHSRATPIPTRGDMKEVTPTNMELQNGEVEQSSESLTELARNTNSLKCVTGKEPIGMSAGVARSCVSVGPDTSQNENAEAASNSSRQYFRHVEAYFRVFVTKSGERAMASNARPGEPFPEGTVILKQKLNVPSGGTVLLYTGMLKRERDYNPRCGDWEFFVIDGDGTRVTARGKLNKCTGCHSQYSAYDYVTKSYPRND